MSTNATDIDNSIKLLLEKLSEEFEIVKRQGFPSHRDAQYTHHPRGYDIKIPEKRWRSWANELDMDATRFEGLLKILVNDGFLEDFKVSPDYI